MSAGPSAVTVTHLLAAAAAQFQAGGLQEAARLCDAALALAPGHADGHNLAAVLYCAQARWDEADAAFARAIAADGQVPGYHYNRGRALEDRGLQEEAAAAYRAAVALDPAYYDAWCRLGVVCYRCLQLVEAHDCLQQALRLRPDEAACIAELGNVLLAAGAPAQAEECYRRALARAPDDIAVAAALGHALAAQGRADEAQAQWNAVARAHENRARTHAAHGDWAAAAAAYQAALSLVPGDADRYTALVDAVAAYTRGLPVRPLPKITVVTPSYNQAAYLEACIDSVLSQNYPRLEYIVMDGGSSDGSVDIIRKYARHLAYWQSGPDGGHYAAVQAGFARSSGEVMTWLNSDDRFHPWALALAGHAFAAHPQVAWLTGRGNVISEGGTLTRVAADLGDISLAMIVRERFTGYIQQEGTFWRRTLWERAGARLDAADYPLGGDFELWLRFFRHAPLHPFELMLASFRLRGAAAGQRSLHLQAQYQAEVRRGIAREAQRHARHPEEPLLPPGAPVTLEALAGGADSAAREPRADPPRATAAGFTYMGVLFLVFLLGLALAAAGSLWKVADQREKERELLYVGDQYRRALLQYRANNTGRGDGYPEQLADLLQDRNQLAVKRYLRRPYADPLTGSTEWGLLRAPTGGIVGVYSRSPAQPLKVAAFPSPYENFSGRKSFLDWAFAAVPVRAGGPAAGAQGQGYMYIATGPDPSIAPDTAGAPDPAAVNPPEPDDARDRCPNLLINDRSYCANAVYVWGPSARGPCDATVSRRQAACLSGAQQLPDLWQRYK